MANLGNKWLISTGIPAFFLGLTAVNANAQSKPLVAEILPPAKAGECYAKVRVPAKYETSKVDVALKAATERFQITPAKFEDKSERVMTREGSSTLEAVQPVVEVVQEAFEVAPARTQWVRDSLTGSVPLTEGEKLDLSSAGVTLDGLPTGSCLYEHFVEPTVKQIPNRVLISEATEELSTTPATYRKASESVLISPAHKRLIEVPAVFRKKQERVLVQAAHSEWQVGTGPIQKIDNITGEIMCRIDIPAQYDDVEVDVIATAPLVTSVSEKAEYKTIDIEQLVADAAEKRDAIPAKFESFNKEQISGTGSFKWLAKRSEGADGEHTGRVVCHQAVPAKTIDYEKTIVKTAGRFERTVVPPTFETVEITALVADASSVKIPVPSVTSTVERRTKVSDARFEWQSVLCETNTTGDIISRLQTALEAEGYEVGAIDGVLGRGTLTALESYQKKNSLAEGGVTMESMEALGVEL